MWFRQWSLFWITYWWPASDTDQCWCQGLNKNGRFCTWRWGRHLPSNFWATFMRNLWHVLKSPGQSLTHNYPTAHLQNKHLSEWFITLCQSWGLYMILCWWKRPKSAWAESICCICWGPICSICCLLWGRGELFGFRFCTNLCWLRLILVMEQNEVCSYSLMWKATALN